MANDVVAPNAPIDPALVLPPAVVAQRDRANALMAQLNGSTAIPPGAGQPQPQYVTPGGEYVQPAPAPPQPTNPTPPPFQLGPPEQPGQLQPQPQPPPQQPQPESYEHLYKSLKGRWDTEVPRLRETAQQQGMRMQQLEQLIGSLQAPPGGAQPQPNGHDPADFTEEEREQWGEDMLTTIARIVDRRTQRITQNAIQPIVQENRRTAQMGMEAYLDQAVPTWRETNFEPGFMDWALAIDPFSGDTRQNLLNRAFTQGDAPRVARFFQAYLSTTAPAAGQPGQQPQPLPPAQAQLPAGPQYQPSNRIPLNELAAPSGAGGSGTGGNPPAPQPRRVYRRSDITRFYSDKALGKYNTPELQAQAGLIEQDIFLAQQEGRVVNG